MKKVFSLNLKAKVIQMNKNYYITTPIYYPSAKPHMGHAYSSIMCQMCLLGLKEIDGYEVHFLNWH